VGGAADASCLPCLLLYLLLSLHSPCQHPYLPCLLLPYLLLLCQLPSLLLFLLLCANSVPEAQLKPLLSALLLLLLLLRLLQVPATQTQETPVEHSSL
jgi:hypothetical protein